MPLSRNEIKTRAIQFSNEWKAESSEKDEAKAYRDDLFNVPGKNMRKTGGFEKPFIRLSLVTILVFFVTLEPGAQLPGARPGGVAKSHASATSKNAGYTYVIIPGAGKTWGYDIYSGKSLFIHQPNIPGLPGNDGFSTKDGARKVALLVIGKIKKGEMPGCPAQAPNTWTQKADVGGVGRQDASGFSIGTKGYIGIGIDINGVYHKDFWEYDPVTDAWTQKADFGGTSRHYATGFSIGTKGYIGTGQDMTTYKNDFWEYDPALNAWTQKADFGGAGRYQAVGFSIGTKGYIGTGWNPAGHLLNDFWEYDPSANTWSQKANSGGDARANAVGFSIGSKGYIGTGNTMSSWANTDFWEYDPSANTWTQKADFGGVGRNFSCGFGIGAKGYIGTGNTTPGLLNDFWEYDPSGNVWTQKANFGGGLWDGAVGICIGSKGYMGTGVSILTGTTNGFWEYTPECSLPPAPVITLAGNVLTSSSPAGNQWYYEGTAITGATGQTYTVTNNTGYYSCTVTLLGCTSPFSNEVWVVVTGQQELPNSNFSVYPVPNDGRFNVRITSPVQEKYTVLVLNQLGVKIFELEDVQVKGTIERQIDLRPLANGVLSVIFLDSKFMIIRKVLINN